MPQTVVYRLKDLHFHHPDLAFLSFLPKDPQTRLIYQAGQYVTLKIADWTLPLSLAKAPDAQHALVFHLRIHPEDPAIQALMAQLANDQTHDFYFTGPFGVMTTSTLKPNHALVLLAGGTGIAPFKALLEDLYLKHNTQVAVSLYWGISKPEDFYLSDLLEDLKTRYANFEYHLILSEPERFPAWQGQTGWLHEWILKQYQTETIPRLTQSQVFASGPFEMIQKCLKTLTALGLKREQFISDIVPSS